MATKVERFGTMDKYDHKAGSHTHPVHPDYSLRIHGKIILVSTTKIGIPLSISNSAGQRGTESSDSQRVRFSARCPGKARRTTQSTESQADARHGKIVAQKNRTPRHHLMTGCRIRKWQLPTLPPGGAVPSAMVSLTSLFGMGRGGSSPL